MIAKRRYLADILLIFTLIAGILILFFRYRYSEEEKFGTSEMAYVSLEVQGISYENAAALHRSDTVSLRDYDMDFGTVYDDARITDYMKLTIDEGGNAAYEKKDGLYTVTFTLLCSGNFSDEGFFLGGKKHIAPNQTLNISTRLTENEAYVVSIEKVPES